MKFHRIHLNHEPALRQEIEALKKENLRLANLVEGMNRQRKRFGDEIIFLSNELESERMRRLTHNETCPKRRGW